MLFRTLLLSATLLVSAQTALAAVPSVRCESVFVRKSPKLAPARAETSRSSVDKTPVTKPSLTRLFKSSIDRAEFTTALAAYRTTGRESLKQPETREEKLALIAYMSDFTGRQSHRIEDWVRNVDGKTMSRFVDSLGHVDVDKGFSVGQIHKIWDKLRDFSMADPRTYTNTLKSGVPKVDEQVLKQWAASQTATEAAVRAVADMGRIRRNNVREKMAEFFRSNPNFTANLKVGAQMLIQYLTTSVALPGGGTTGVVITAPTFSKLQRIKLDPALAKRIENGEIDQIYPELEARYGKAVAFDTRVFWARRAYSTMMITYLLVQAYPQLVNSMLSTGLIDDDASFFEVMEACLSYYSGAVKTIVVDVVLQRDTELEKKAAPKKQTQMQAVSEVDDSASITADRDVIQPRSSDPKSHAPEKKQPPANKALEDALDALNEVDAS